MELGWFYREERGSWVWVGVVEGRNNGFGACSVGGMEEGRVNLLERLKSSGEVYLEA